MNQADTIVRLASAPDQTQWDEVASHPLQSWAWGQFRENMGIDVMRLIQERNGKLIDGWQITFHPIPHTPYTIGYFPKGPAPTNAMIDTLTKLGQQKKAIFIQLEPNVLSNSQFARPERSRRVIRNSQFFRPSHHPLFTKHTFVIDLTKSEDELMKAMHPKTRYNIKVAQKHHVTITEDNSQKAFDTYLALTHETTTRQGFFAHNDSYHRCMWQTMRDAKIAHLFTATYQGNVLAAWIVFVWHNTIYYPYGASSRCNREVMAPNLLPWEIIRWAKKQGLNQFDLWGALGTNPDPNNSWFGFHRFKEGYGATLVEYIGSWDLVINPFLYTLYKVTDTLRWTVLKLKKR